MWVITEGGVTTRSRFPDHSLTRQTFRVHQKRTANISNSRTSTNHLGPSARYWVIYRFRRRTNHHDSTILSMNCLFILISGCGLKESWSSIQTMFYIALSIGPVSPKLCSLYPIRTQKSRWYFLPAPCSELSSYLKPLILAISPYNQAHWISRDRKSVSYLLERGTPT